MIDHLIDMRSLDCLSCGGAGFIVIDSLSLQVKRSRIPSLNLGFACTANYLRLIYLFNALLKNVSNTFRLASLPCYFKILKSLLSIVFSRFLFRKIATLGKLYRLKGYCLSI